VGPFFDQTKSCQLAPVHRNPTPLSRALAHHDHWFAYYGVTRSKFPTEIWSPPFSILDFLNSSFGKKVILRRVDRIRERRHWDDRPLFRGYNSPLSI